MASKWALTKASEFCKELRSSGVGDLTGKQERAIAASYDVTAEEVLACGWAFGQEKEFEEWKKRVLDRLGR